MPNAAIAAFSPEVFTNIGYPHRIESSRELWRYHDVMQDGRLSGNLRLLGSRADEFVELIRSAAERIIDFSKTYFGVVNAGTDMLSRAVLQYVLLSLQLQSVQKPWTILEVGPGSGYLGILLGLDGHRYLALEASQAFWIYQSSLFSHVFGDAYFSGLGPARNSRLRHIPWWEFCYEGYQLPSLSACTANHMLAEMNSSALTHLMRKIATSQTITFPIVAEDLGLCRYNEEHETLKRITKAGFKASEVEPRVWLFERTEGARSISRIVTKPDSMRAKLAAVPVVGELLRRSPGLLKAFRVVSRIVLRKNDDGSALMVGKKEFSVVGNLFTSLPQGRGADARFTDGTW